jgi:TetR/AcrR family transcriptional regulator, cholesterol catabolism regulator
VTHKIPIEPSPPSASTVLLERRITPAQAARRAKAIAAARMLAQQGGYVAVNMTDVAARSGFGRATLYRYFASKDHLLAEVTAQWGAEIIAELRSRPPRGRTASERVASVFERVFEVAREQSRLTEAAVTAALSADPSAMSAWKAGASVVEGYLESALGDEPLPEREEVGRALGYVFLSALILMTSGRVSAEEAVAQLASAVRLMLEPRTPVTPPKPGHRRALPTGRTR